MRSCRRLKWSSLKILAVPSTGTKRQALAQRLYNIMANAPRRLEVVFQKYDPPLYFITFNTYRRRQLLAKTEVQAVFIRFAARGTERDLAIGRYVIMPDHIHLFARGSHNYSLAQ